MEPGKAFPAFLKNVFWTAHLGALSIQMVIPPSDYFSIFSLSRNSSMGRLPGDTGCPEAAATAHVSQGQASPAAGLASCRQRHGPYPHACTPPAGQTSLCFQGWQNPLATLPVSHCYHGDAIRVWQKPGAKESFAGLDEACPSVMRTVEADDGARLREEGDGVSSMPSRGVQWKEESRAAVCLEQSPPRLRRGGGFLIRTKIRASLSLGAAKCSCVLLGRLKFLH